MRLSTGEKLRETTREDRGMINAPTDKIAVGRSDGPTFAPEKFSQTIRAGVRFEIASNDFY